jgi:hypothetical protein
MSLSRITTDSFITPLKAYHTRVKKTFKPYDAKTFKGKLAELIKRIIYLLFSPVLYTLTIALATTGYGLKGLCRLVPEKTRLERNALRLVGQRRFMDALQYVNKGPDLVKNSVKEAICRKNLEKGSQTTNQESQDAFRAASSIKNDPSLKDRLFQLVIKVDIQRGDVSGAEKTALWIEDEGLKTKMNIDICIAKHKYEDALKLLVGLNNLSKGFDAQANRDYIEKCCQHIYEECSKDSSSSEDLQHAEAAIDLMTEGSEKRAKYFSLIRTLTDRNLLEKAEKLIDRLPNTDSYYPTKDNSYYLLAREFQYSYKDNTKACELIQKISPSCPEKEHYTQLFSKHVNK